MSRDLPAPDTSVLSSRFSAVANDGSDPRAAVTPAKPGAARTTRATGTPRAARLTSSTGQTSATSRSSSTSKTPHTRVTPLEGDTPEPAAQVRSEDESVPMVRRTYYYPQEVADELAEAVDGIHFDSRGKTPKHAALAQIIRAGLEHTRSQ